MINNFESRNLLAAEVVNPNDDGEPELVDLAVEATPYNADAVVSFIFSRVLCGLTALLRAWAIHPQEESQRDSLSLKDTAYKHAGKARTRQPASLPHSAASIHPVTLSAQNRFHCRR